jgi:UTP:GlnB (protein PII) uridylyltransferase
VKERPGGLRDIELAMLAWKVIRRCTEPLGPRLLLKFAEEMPQYRELFHDLLRSYQLLNRLRDVYRLTVGPTNTLDPERLETPAHLLGYRPRAAMSASAFLRQDCERHCEQSAKAVDTLLRLAIRD